MKTRRLGKSGLQVTEVGLGCWQLGGDFGPIEDATAQHVLQTARQGGINVYDTADVYGDGRSERLVGGHLKPGELVATKVGRSPDLYPDGYSEEAVREHVLASIERLGVDRLDLIQLHCVPPELLARGEIFDWMRALQAEGLCRAWGASVETMDEAQTCLKQEGLTSLQIIFNLFRQDAATELFEAAKQADVGIIARVPLASGLLTGKFTRETEFASTDQRNFNRDGSAFSVGETFAGIPFEEGLDLVDALRAFKPDGWSMVQFALRWILDFDAVSTVIAGASKPSQVRSNIEAASLAPLPSAVHEGLAEFYTERVRDLVQVPV